MNLRNLLYLILDHDAVFMLTQKVINMIKAFPDYSLPLNVETLMNGFKWLYGTIEDDELPVATELFRSSFDDAIHYKLDELDGNYESVRVGDFLLECGQKYFEQMDLFVTCFMAIASNASGKADEDQKSLATLFEENAGKWYEIYSKKCSVRHEKGRDLIEVYRIRNFWQLLVFEYCRLKKENKTFKKCLNCEKIFIPENRIDSIYCSEQSPQRSEKTCREIGAQVRRIKKRNEDPKERAHHNCICKFHNAIRRQREKQGDISYYKKQIDREMINYEEEKNKEKK